MSDDDHEQDVAKLLAHAAALLSGASANEILITYYETLKEFFGGSNYWQEVIGFTVVPNTLDYPIEPVEHGQIIRLMNVIDQNNVPQNAVMPEIGTVHFLYPYSIVQSMIAIVSKTVKRPFKDGRPFPPHIPKDVLPSYGTGILEGLVGRMEMESGQPYTDPQRGMIRRISFRNTISEARVFRMRANTVGAQAWCYPQTFRTSGQKAGVSTFNVSPSPLTSR